MQRSSYEMDHFSSYVSASQSWYSTFASFRSWRAASTSAAVACGFGMGSSLATERRLSRAVLDERPHARLLVLRREQCREHLAFQAQPAVQVAVETTVDRGLRCRKR